MGSFFTNVQFYTGTRPVAEVRAALISALRSRWLEDGSMEEAPSGQPAEVEVAVGPAADEPWIAVYDRASEDQHDEVLSDLAARLSVAVGVSAVTVLVHDSDVLQLQLFDHGRRRDSFVNKPDYFGEELSDHQRKALAGKPRVWARLLPHVSAAELKAAWREADGAFDADEMLARLAGLLKWNSQLASLGLNMLDAVRLAAIPAQAGVRKAVSAAAGTRRI